MKGGVVSLCGMPERTFNVWWKYIAAGIACIEGCRKDRRWDLEYFQKNYRDLLAVFLTIGLGDRQVELSFYERGLVGHAQQLLDDWQFRAVFGVGDERAKKLRHIRELIESWKPDLIPPSGELEEVARFLCAIYYNEGAFESPRSGCWAV